MFGRVTFFLLPIFGLLASIFYGIPQTDRFFRSWKKTHNHNWFSSAVFLGFASLTFILFFYLTYVQIAFHYKALLHSEIVNTATFFIVVYLTYSLFIPKTLYFYERWKLTKRKTHLSMMSFFGCLSFYFLSLLFLQLINSAIGIFQNVL